MLHPPMRFSELEAEAHKDARDFCGIGLARDFRVLLRQKTTEWRIIVYSARCLPSRDLAFGCSVVSVANGEGGGGTTRIARSLPEESLVDCYSHTSHGRYALAYGRVLDARVDAVEVVFTDGRTVRERPANGVYAAFAPEVERGVQLRTMDVTGSILQQLDISSCF